jgi:DNA-binding MarR family transcriptional regulator
MEPTTLSAISGMEAAGIVRRERDPIDRRKIRVFLTEKGRALEAEMLPLAIDTIATAVRGVTPAQVDALLASLKAIQTNLEADLAEE